MAVRQLPQAIDTETALLGSMLIYPSTIETAIEQGLVSNDFYLEQNKTIYKAIVALYNEKSIVNIRTLTDRLNDLQVINQIGGQDYLSQLADTAGSSATAKHYIQTVQEKARLRDLIVAAEKITEDSFESQYAMNEVMDNAEKELLKVTRSRKATSFVNIKESVDETVSDIRKMSENHTPVTGLETNFRDLDRITNGFQKGDLIILAARPSMGKTAFALSLAMNIAECNNKPVAIFSLEMDANALVKRMLSSKSGLDGNKLRSGYGITNDEMNCLVEAGNELKVLPIYFNDNSSEVTPTAIQASCRKLASEHGLGAIVIDYIQLMSGTRSDSRQQEVSEISRSLKGIARELQVPVIALSQLSRSVESRQAGNRRPMLSDLRESGALEQDADMVIFLYRDSYYAYLGNNGQEAQEEKYERSNESNGIEEMEVIIAKHRNGATDTIKLAYNRQINAFYDFDYSHNEEN